MPYCVSYRRKKDPVVVFLAGIVGLAVLSLLALIYHTQTALPEAAVTGRSVGLTVADRYADTNRMRRTTRPPEPPKPRENMFKRKPDAGQ